MNRSEAGKLGYAKSSAVLLVKSAEKSAKAREAYAATQKQCKFCKDPIPYERRANSFCTTSCAASYNGTRRKRKAKCKSCGDLARKGCRTCAACNAVARLKVLVLEDAKTDLSRKTLLIRQRGRKCEACAYSVWMEKPIPLELDHIDGNSDDNSSDNLRLLCPNCHAQTPTYKAKNKGKNTSRQVTRRSKYIIG